MLSNILHWSPANLWQSENRLNQIPSPFKHAKNIDDVLSIVITANFSIQQAIFCKTEILKFLNQDEVTEVQYINFIKKVMIWGFEQDLRATEDFLTDLIDIKKLKRWAQNKFDNSNQGSNTIHDIAKCVAEENPNVNPITLKERVALEWKKCRPLFIYFIPNVINIFLEVFNFIDNQKKYTSLWEKHLLVEIVYKFILIPFTLVQILNPILVVPRKVYITSISIILGTGLFIGIYKRWFKPIPNDIVNCKNLDKILENKAVKVKVGQSEALNRLITALLGGMNVLIVGKSGEGKTALAHHLVQLKKEGKLPKQLQKLHMFSLNCGDLMGHGTFGHSEMINQTKDNMEGYESDLLVFFDEIDQLTANPACFQTFKQRFLNEDEPSPAFIAAVTLEGLKKIKQLDIDGSFMQRVEPIVIESAEDEQCRLVLNEFLSRNGKDLPISHDAVDQVIESSKSTSYLPNVGRLAKAKKIMRAVIGRCQYVFSDNYNSKELAKAKDDYQGTALSEVQKRNELRETINASKREEVANKEQIAKIKLCFEKRKMFMTQYSKLAHQLTNKISTSKKVQAEFLLDYLYGKDVFEHLIESQVQPLRSKKIDVEINSDLVKDVFANICKEDQKIK
ncbi:MAG: ATP-binding protein [Parachlamydiaceae bacterium]|nr:ATP-binding protein [Parachlamydiaceae bacterium]